MLASPTTPVAAGILSVGETKTLTFSGAAPITHVTMLNLGSDGLCLENPPIIGGEVAIGPDVVWLDYPISGAYIGADTIAYWYYTWEVPTPAASLTFQFSMCSTHIAGSDGGVTNNDKIIVLPSSSAPTLLTYSQVRDRNSVKTIDLGTSVFDSVRHVTFVNPNTDGFCLQDATSIGSISAPNTAGTSDFWVDNPVDSGKQGGPYATFSAP